MKLLKVMMTALLLTIAVGSAEAKRIQAPHVYMFGFSASFKDSVVYITDINDVQGAWMESKSKFLSGIENYSYQLRDYFNTQLSMPDRVCMVFYATSFKKAERKFVKLKKKYTGTKKKPAHYEIRFVSLQDFRFQPVDMSPEQE